MDSDDIRAFARRDWQRLGDGKAAFWRERKQVMSTAELLSLSDQLRIHALAVRPDWPDVEVRAADLRVHQRVSEALRAVPRGHR